MYIYVILHINVYIHTFLSMPYYHNFRFASPTTKESEEEEPRQTKPPRMKTKTYAKPEAKIVLNHPRSPAATICLKKRTIRMATAPKKRTPLHPIHPRCI